MDKKEAEVGKQVSLQNGKSHVEDVENQGDGARDTNGETYEKDHYALDHLHPHDHVRHD